ncbi:transglutaminase family protein [Consotaella salsifontis]|uniref:Transglutaminase-like enzyme, putative cysteine protease n=1 Tax=Consotaella salsifontis TaxID=1365950 RepID=A0A1T4SQC3_9HYPH|nr:transglutaminase family protein [Consotaella salsifontis]SKA30480.1 Transglutaminase-like enzyme, putative cysteine protease [Consotaella salsifontis]
MICDIRLRIGTDYPSAVGESSHLLRVRPRAGFGQSVEAASLLIDPRPGEQGRETDFFGNTVDRFRIDRAHDRLSIEMRARVAVERTAPDLNLALPVGEVARAAEASRDLAALSPAHFLGSSRAVKLVPDVTAYAAARSGRRVSVGRACLDLATTIRNEFTYEEGFTDVTTDVAAAFALRRGVCQDFAHVMIAGLRGLGLPAAYASGYLKTDPPPGQPRIEGVDAMHAWVMAWLGPEIGWIGFDPTNGILAGEGHIIAAIGRDYADIAPMAGVVTTAGAQRSWHAVDVVPVD